MKSQSLKILCQFIIRKILIITWKIRAIGLSNKKYGRFSSLEEVVEHYNNGGNYSTTIDPLMKNIGIGLQLTNQEKNDLIAFLKTLSDDDFLNR